MNPSIRSLCAACGAALLVVGSALAVDVPWTFEGDTSRTGQSASVPDAGVLTSFATWTKTADVSTWTFAESFSSMAPGYLLFLR